MAARLPWPRPGQASCSLPGREAPPPAAPLALRQRERCRSWGVLKLCRLAESYKLAYMGAGVKTQLGHPLLYS